MISLMASNVRACRLILRFALNGVGEIGVADGRTLIAIINCLSCYRPSSATALITGLGR